MLLELNLGKPASIEVHEVRNLVPVPEPPLLVSRQQQDVVDAQPVWLRQRVVEGVRDAVGFGVLLQVSEALDAVVVFVAHDVSEEGDVFVAVVADHLDVGLSEDLSDMEYTKIPSSEVSQSSGASLWIALPLILAGSQE